MKNRNPFACVRDRNGDEMKGEIMDFQEAIKKAKHLKALVQEVYLHGKGLNDKPWSYVESCEPGGSHRLEIHTDVWFRATYKGVKFRWSFDIEPYSANGKGSYEIDARACAEVIKRLPANAAKEFRKYLAECAKAVHAKGNEFKAVADKQFRDAAILATLAD